MNGIPELGEAAKVGGQELEEGVVQVQLGDAEELRAPLGDLLQRVHARVEDREVLQLLDGVRDVEEGVLAQVELHELGQRREGRRQGVQVVVAQVEGPGGNSID